MFTVKNSLLFLTFRRGVVALADTFPSFLVSGPFIPDVPSIQVPSESVFPPQLRSSSRALPLHLHFHNCSHALFHLLLCNVAEPFQPSPSHDHRYLWTPLLPPRSPHFSGVPTGSHPLPITTFCCCHTLFIFN